MATNASQDGVAVALGKVKLGLVGVAIFSLCENVLLLASPIYMMQVYDRVLASRSTDTLIYLTAALLLALLTLAVLDLARGRILGRLAHWLEQSLAPKLFERSVQSSLRGTRYGVEAMTDMATLRAFVTSPGMTSLFDLPWTPLFVFAAFVMHPYLGMLALGSTTLLLALGVLGELLTRKQVRMTNEHAVTSRRDVEAATRNAEVVESMGMMASILGAWNRRNAVALDVQASLGRRTTLLTSTTKFVRLLMQSMGLGLGAWLVINQQATGGVMIAASILLSRAASPIEQTIGSWKNVLGVRGALKRLRAIDREPKYRAPAMDLPTPRGELSAEALIYAPNSDLPILKGISFQLEAGSALAVVGKSGAGKSSLARLLAGAVRPTRGTVRVDGADLFSWSRSQVGDFVGYLPQDVELFSGTVAQNIARFADVPSEDIVAAARMANVHDLIVNLPNGYDTEIGEHGQHLSGGQRQRVALARAVLGRPRLVILDEPNANLDAEGEDALVQAMISLKQLGSTVVIITHRPSLVLNVDRMLLLRDGQIEAFGGRQEVLARIAAQSVPRRPAPAQAPHPASLENDPRIAAFGRGEVA